MSYPPQQNAWQGQQQPGYQPQPGYPQQQPQQYAPQQVAPQGYPGSPAGYAAAQPKPNPFAGTPVSDWVRDGAAIVLLLASLALPWSRALTFSSDTVVVVAATRVEVLLITLLSALSVVVGYLARAGVFGPAFTAPKAALTRALLGLPYALLILLYVVFDAVRMGDLGANGGPGIGLGPAAAVGLAGAVLAAVPRRYEILSPAFSATAAKHGYGFVIGYFVFGAVTALLGIVLTLIRTFQLLNDYGDPDVLLLIVWIVFSLALALSPLLLILLVLRRFESARIIALAFGITMVFGSFIAVFASQGSAESVAEVFGYPALVLAAGAGVMSHAGLPYAMRQQQPLAAWHSALKQAPIALMIGLLLFVVACIAVIIASEGQGIGFIVGVLICLVLSIVAALVLRMQLASNFLHGRVISASIAGAILVAGLVAVILAGIHNTRPFEGYDLEELRQIFLLQGASGYLTIAAFKIAWLLTVFFAAPALVLFGLFAPKPVREYFAAAKPQAPTYPAQQVQQAPQQVQPQQAPQPQQPEVDPALAARAADPATPPSEQFEMSKQRELWPYLAQNPSLYEDLANWLAQTGDPQTLAALQARGR